MKVNEAALRPSSLGLFCLPGISDEIPLNDGGGLHRDKVFARLALVAEEQGLPLPGGNFDSITSVVARQWSDYLEKERGSDFGRLLQGCPVLVIEDGGLTFLVECDHALRTFIAKPVVKSLEAQMQGLGWFVMQVIDVAVGHGFELYKEDTFWYFSSRLIEMAEFTDEAYAKQLLIEEGGDPKSVDESEIERLKEEYHGNWPSELLELFDGHVHLLGWSGKDYVKPKAASMEEVEMWLSQNKSHELAPCVTAAFELMQLLQRNEHAGFSWYHGGQAGYEEDRIGAMAILCWNDVDLVHDLTEEHEQMAMQGDSVYGISRYIVDMSDVTDEKLKAMVHAAKAYFNVWGQFEKLISHFPEWG